MRRAPTSTPSIPSSGFSLVEVLTTVALIGILTAIAIIAVSNLNDVITDTHDQRNAQEFVVVCTSATTAGVNFASSGDLDTTLNAIVTGATPTDGVFKGRTFMLPGLSSQDVTNAKHYLVLLDGQLTYHPGRLP